MAKFSFDKFWKVSASIASILALSVFLAAFPLSARLKRVEEVQVEQKEAVKVVKVECKEQLELHLGYIKEDIEDVKSQMMKVVTEVSNMRESFSDFKVELIREIQKIK